MVIGRELLTVPALESEAHTRTIPPLWNLPSQLPPLYRSLSWMEHTAYLGDNSTEPHSTGKHSFLGFYGAFGSHYIPVPQTFWSPVPCWAIYLHPSAAGRILKLPTDPIQHNPLPHQKLNLRLHAVTFKANCPLPKSLSGSLCRGNRSPPTSAYLERLTSACLLCKLTPPHLCQCNFPNAPQNLEEPIQCGGGLALVCCAVVTHFTPACGQRQASADLAQDTHL